MRKYGVLAAAAAFALAGCAVTDQFGDRVQTYDYVAMQSRDAMVLTNIVRASHAEPLGFVQLGQINGMTGSTGILGLPPLVLGPKPPNVPALKDAIFGSSAYGGVGFIGNQLQMTGSTSFQATPAETKDFYLGLLREVEPRTLALFIQQGVAREVLFYLFTDRIIGERSGQKFELRNDPLDPHYQAFVNYVRLAISYGLSSERVDVPSDKRARAADDSASPDSKDSRNAPPPERWRLCFDKAYWDHTQPWADDQPVCGSDHFGVDDRVISFIGKDHARVTFHVLPRSAFAIFQYLGRVVAAGEKGKIQLTSPDAIDNGPMRDDLLFDVETGAAAGGDCFLSVSYEGQSYCVPRDGAANTKRILGLLVQLIALNTAIEDVPVTPTVRVVQ